MNNDKCERLPGVCFSAVPLETAVGLEAVQQPLRERYSGDDGDVPGIDAWCTVFSSGIQMQVRTKPLRLCQWGRGSVATERVKRLKILRFACPKH